MKTNFSTKVARLLIGAAAMTALLDTAHPSQVPQVRVYQAACGALLRDNFDAGVIDGNLWNVAVEDPGIRVTVESGELCIRGTSARIPEAVLSNKEVKLWRFAGLASRTFSQTDVVLAVRVKMPSGISNEPGLHGVSIHLCGVTPDTYPEVLFGKVEGKATEQILHRYAKDTPDDVPYPDARGWFLGVINQDQGDDHYLISGQPMPQQGDEERNFHEVVVEYDGEQRLARAFLKLGERWVPLGKAEPLIRGLSQVELKLIDVTPLHGAYREARFDDCRLYPNPRHNPVRLIAVDDHPKQFPALTGAPYGMRYRGQRLRVALYTRDLGAKISEAYTDQYGMVDLSVYSPAWIAFPVSAVLRLFLAGKEIARATIEAHGIDGLYPGDVWVLDASQIQGAR